MMENSLRFSFIFLLFRFGRKMSTRNKHKFHKVCERFLLDYFGSLIDFPFPFDVFLVGFDIVINFRFYLEMPANFLEIEANNNGFRINY
jgi:hypothetical protein